MGFGDVTKYPVYNIEELHGFGAVAVKQKQKQPQQPSYPALAAASTSVNLERRLKVAGVKVPERKPKQNLLTRALDILDRPGAAVRGAVMAAYKGQGLKGAIEAAKKGWRGQERVSGQEILAEAAKRGAPLAQTLTKSKAGRFIGGLAAEILLDPTTYITGGTSRVAATGKNLAKAIEREVLKETGKRITGQTAARLAENALRGQIPVGRLGTAINRALGRTAETKTVTTGFGSVARAQRAQVFGSLAQEATRRAKQLQQETKEARSYARTLSPTRGAMSRVYDLQQQVREQKELAKRYRQQARAKVPPTTATVSVVAGEPGITRTTLRFMGVPILDVTPVRTALGALVQRSPHLTVIRDRLGRIFSFNYTPLTIKGVERALVTGAKERITQAVREIPHAREKAMRELAQQWQAAGISREAAEMAPEVIEQTMQGTPEARRAARMAEKMFAEDAARFAREGIPLNVIDNYVTHLYEDPPEKVKAVLDRWRQMHARAQVPGAKPFFTKQRTIPTIQEARQLGLNPITDVRQLTMVHRALTEQAVILQKMGRDLVKMGPDIVRDTNPGGWVNVTDTAIPDLKGKWVHPEVYEALKNLYPIIHNTDEGISHLAAMVDALHRAWKAVVLFRPSFHLRNLIGNVFLNIADGVLNPLRYPQAAAVLTKAIPYVELAGRQVPTEVVLDWFGRYALRGQGAFRETLHGATRAVTEEARRMLDALERGGFGQVAYWVKHPFEGSRQLGEAVDSLCRLANFLHHLDNGLSPAEAAARTRRALFDYSELTQAERAIRRWAIPFYAWTRFALPRMVERLVGAPGVFTGAAHLRENAVSINEVDERHLPEYLRDMQAIPLWVDDKGQVHYLTLNLPLTELTRIHDPRSIDEAFRELTTMLSPLMTVPVQLAMNRVLLTDQEITRYRELGGLPMLRDYGMFLASQLGMPREIVNKLREAEQRREYEMALAEGKPQEVEPVQKEAWESIAGITSVQRPEVWARTAQYRRREQLMQAAEVARQRGIVIPETEELPPMAERRGFGAVASRGFGFGAVFQRQMLADVRDVPDVIRAAMDMAGVDPSWGPYLVLLMRAESGGNPLAVNKLWVEYSTGRVSTRREGPGWYRATGLFQLMPPTFEKYKIPGHDDIFNPLDNALAAINYIRANYGHPANIPGLGTRDYKGY